MFSEFEHLKNVDLKKFSTIKIGGKINFIVFPKNHLEVLKILEIIKQNKLRWFVLGNGSNILFPDKGFDGVAISLKHFNKIVQMGECVWVGAGVNVFAINVKLAKLGLSGMEWSYGIPASVGGMVVGNAGCFEHEMGEAVQELLVVEEGILKILKKDQLQFGYRSAKYNNLDLKKFIILAVKLQLFQEKSEKIAQNMNFFLNKKRESQPCDKFSLGSVFKRIEASGRCYPAKLIDKMGLKGVKIGEAEVSTKHAGFIINSGNAKAEDVLQLIELIESKLAEYGVFPEREIEVFD